MLPLIRRVSVILSLADGQRYYLFHGRNGTGWRLKAKSSQHPLKRSSRSSETLLLIRTFFQVSAAFQYGPTAGNVFDVDPVAASS
jgi:hypothetical protein